ncbi:hypothetical protein C0Q70_16665 [Pomacea canaliculata]|uniref:Peroxisomal membrane protein PEX14-like KPWE domain-containing protein n=1 Tax=Pomacea canaliculata TaxID=400727 RepID=A0A2T7NQG6_POMCA|nr:hypothetical protein C0Q70_16665 [Pomacea canaliculata]
MEQRKNSNEDSVPLQNVDATTDATSPVKVNSEKKLVGDNEELSFAEIVKCIQKGRTIPGIMSLEVVASDQSPTPSNLRRSRKPWEQ